MEFDLAKNIKPKSYYYEKTIYLFARCDNADYRRM